MYPEIYPDTAFAHSKSPQTYNSINLFMKQTTHQVLALQCHFVLASLAFFVLVLCCPFAIQGQTFYDINTVQEIRINFAQANWDFILDTMRANNSTNRLVATTVLINGTTFNSVGVSYKGNSSYNAANVKNPFHLELDYVVATQHYQGYEHIKLSNGSHDPTQVREVLSYEIARKYMPVSLANYSRVYVNNVFLGLYGNVEAVSKEFLPTRFFTNDHTLIMADKPDGLPPGTNPGSPTLNFLGNDSTLYYNIYDVKSDFGWADLSNLCNQLNNNVNNVQQMLDVDRALWMLAFNNLFVNLDSYTGSIGHNYYLCEDINNRFNTILWDLNESFGRFAGAGTGGTGGGQLTYQQMRDMDPLLHSTNTGRPLIKKLLENASHKKQYTAHLRTMLSENVSNGWYLTRAQQIQAIIDADVQADPNKFYSYANFLANINTDVAGSGGGQTGAAIGLSSLMNGRNTFLQNHAELLKVAPTINSVQHTPTSPNINTMVWVAANISGTTTQVTLGYRHATSEIFNKVQMFDDGLHNDGAANNGVYGASIPATMISDIAQYYVYAEDADAGAFSPPRAEYEFYVVQYLVPLSTIQTGQLVINEFAASNISIMPDEAGQYDDWIELHNNTNQTLSLAGLYLSDDPAALLKWQFPLNTTIAPNGYLIVWADESGAQGNLHANFKLSKTGEQISLSKSNLSILDQMTFGAQTDNVTTGRIPNGTGTFVLMPPTFSLYNVPSSCVSQPVISGNFLPCNGGSTFTYSIVPVSGASYYWNVVGGTILSGQGTASIQVQWNGAVGTAGTVDVVRVN